MRYRSSSPPAITFNGRASMIRRSKPVFEREMPERAIAAGLRAEANSTCFNARSLANMARTIDSPVPLPHRIFIQRSDIP